MTSKRDNETLIRVGPGTPMGELMRQYWMPAALSSELVADGDPVRLTLLGEKLIAFRDSDGKVGILDHRCPHRCASLFFGRNEEGGIRCVYHGWKFDADGNCLDMANVPPHQDFKHKVKAKSYRTAERNGAVWVYMGDQENPPALPRIEATLVAEADNNIDVFQRECNWLQALEGDIDTSHVNFLHGGGRTMDTYDADNPLRYGVKHPDPEYQLQETDWGAMYGAYRPAEEGMTYWRIAHFMMPFWSITPSAPFGLQVYARAWVPMDDTHSMSFRFVWKEGRLRGVGRRSQSATTLGNVGHLPNTNDWYGRFRLKRNRANDYLIDRAAQRTSGFSGIEGISEQDQMVTEGMGEITDRTWEHLAPSDEMITLTRRLLLRSARALAKAGSRPRGADQPDVYYQARGGYFTAPSEESMQDLYWKKLAETRSEIPFAMAAE